jgi:hypothetical protein
MYSRIARFFFGVSIALIFMMVGIGVGTSSEPLQRMCRTSCWINDILFVSVGDDLGKIALGLLWFSAGSLILFLMWRSSPNKKSNQAD